MVPKEEDTNTACRHERGFSGKEHTEMGSLGKEVGEGPARQKELRGVKGICV